ncbi:phage minor capsid protein [Paenibacillus sp. NPDC057967]|uniref:phage minor capsid protein n=1 Tax=Paenibacillus sp. NPDC057967 TaxID=3346293 RepID=UPI0036D971D3
MTERDIAELVAAYKDAVKRIRAELLSLDLTDMSRANTESALREVARILTSLNEESAAWVTQYVPESAKAGVAQAIVGLGVAETVKDAEKIAKFNRINSNMVAAAVADTQADLLAVTQNIDRRTKAVVRRVTAESIRANLTAGINGRRTISRDILTGMRRELESAIDTGIVDADGRRWKPEVYVDMVTRTKTAEASREAAVNEAIGRGAYYGVISTHGATDACSKYEGMIVKLTPDAPGDYRYIGELPRREIFHPNCRHSVTPLREPARLEK